MRTLRFFVAVVSAFAFAPAISLAADLEQQDVIQESWQCGSKIDVSPSVTARFSPTYMFAKSDSLPTFIAGEIRDQPGAKFSAVFADTDAGWQGYAVEGQASFSNAYASSATGRAVLFSMISTEGPGQTYTVATTQDGFKTITCGELPAPDTKFETLDYMRIESFDLDEKGHGLLTGVVRFSDDRPAECFQSVTEDSGQHWTKPSRTKLCIDDAFNELAPLPQESGPLHDLRMYSGN
ncbi:hypothetical protein [Rhizobium leguminosarum]|uniref:hypothetical protein n=1 Tax=Rhizobium leguminosarum TaxID=384 RepID=UPI003F96A660